MWEVGALLQTPVKKLFEKSFLTIFKNFISMYLDDAFAYLLG
jgi:hypothetical protein